MNSYTAQKMKFSILNFFSKYDQIRRNFLWSDTSREQMPKLEK